MALAAWATGSAARNVHRRNDGLVRVCPRAAGDSWVDDIQSQLVPKLSNEAKVYMPGSGEFDDANNRWSALEAPKVNVVIVPTTADDVVETVKFANKKDVPFLAYNGAHGALTTMGKMDSGINIFMKELSSVDIAEDGKSVKLGGGTNSKLVTDTLWDAGKQAVTGTCECVSYLGPALGGGHGWLQGHHGLIADQFLSMDIVLANGSLKTVNADSDLWWAMKGAGHNFGIVTSVTINIFDIKHSDWAIETLTYSGDKVEAVYQAVNDHLSDQPAEVINWSYWLNNPGADANKPVIILYIIQEGVKAVDPAITKPFHDIGTITTEPKTGTYKDLAGWTGIAIDSPPCQKVGLSNPRFPIYLDTYDVPAMKAAYDLFAAQANITTAFHNSIFMFEGYSTQGVKAIPAESTAFAFRGENYLAAPLISYEPSDADLDKQASTLGLQLRDILQKASGRQDLRTYVNYAYGAETTQQWYGAEQWRQDRLKALKQKYDSNGKFNFYAPIA
ncbi:hypothetical protein FQN49_002524 [Arthroderma sp. PD_2]|nr:hypothetical protein FQN49_002524 [Arthroderma sp. PD_2]